MTRENFAGKICPGELSTPINEITPKISINEKDNSTIGFISNINNPLHHVAR